METCRAAMPSMTQDTPLKNISMPTNVPMTHKADTGHSRQIMMPKISETCRSAGPSPNRKTGE